MDELKNLPEQFVSTCYQVNHKITHTKGRDSTVVFIRESNPALQGEFKLIALF